MKIVTQDYGCGTSSSILDYNIDDVIVVSPDNFDFLFDIQEDLFFVGHDFLFFLWDNKEKIQRWKKHNHRKAVWCFERINAIIPQWKAKSEYSLNILKQFVDQIYVCDEDDADLYGDWLPQWASCNFFQMKDKEISFHDKFLFSGQAGRPEYQIRTDLLNKIFLDKEIKNMLEITNHSRRLSWEDYCNNLLSYNFVLNPVGILRGFNTRTYEVMYSGRYLIQQTFGKYKRHEKLLKGHNNVILFENFDEMKEKISNISNKKSNPKEFYNNNNIYARFKSIGIEIK